MHLRSIIGSLFAGWMALAISVPADVIWSGATYQRVYHEVPAIDFNLDGTNDFTFDWSFIDTPYRRTYSTYIDSADGQVVVEVLSGVVTTHGISLSTGTEIGHNLTSSGQAWTGEKSILFDVSFTGAQSPDIGGFFGAGYLGVSFDLEGSTHYGWIELSHDETRPEPDGLSLMVHGWAWETEADTPIIAGAIPEPSTGILTMIGSLALLQLARSRRRRKQSHKPAFGYRSPQTSKEPAQW